LRWLLAIALALAKVLESRKSVAPEPEPRSLQASLPSFPHSETWPESPLPDAGADCATATFLPGDKSIVTVTITSESDLEPYCLRRQALSRFWALSEWSFPTVPLSCWEEISSSDKEPKLAIVVSAPLNFWQTRRGHNDDRPSILFMAAIKETPQTSRGSYLARKYGQLPTASNFEP